MEKEHIMKLRSFFLKDLLPYFRERLYEVITPEEISQYVEGERKRTNLIIKDSDSGFCRSISIVVSMCLKAYGFNAEPRDIKILLGNKYARSTIDKYGYEGLIKRIRKDKKIYTLGCGLTEDIKDFHTIVTIDNKYLLDMTLKNAKRIEEGVIINNYFCTMDELIKKYKSILFYEVKLEPIIKNCTILEHPDIKEIVNYILKQISKRLNILEREVNKIIIDY